MDRTSPKGTTLLDASSKNEAFQLLSDQTRLEILQALWEAQSTTGTSSMRFADLREQISVDDPGQIYYHLQKLATHFIRRTDHGYELRESGNRIVRILLSGTAIDDPEIEPVPVDISCWYCDGQPLLRYHDGWRYLECTHCAARCVDTFPPGVISKSEYPPSGLRNRTPNEINDADRIWEAHRRASVMDGVCPECAGDMPVATIDICENHHPNWDKHQFCEACGSIFRMLAKHVCDVCNYSWKLPTLFYPSRHPAVTAFYYNHGIEFDLARHEQRNLILDYREKLLSEDPLRIQITIPLEDDELTLTFDEQMTVVDVVQ